MNLSLFLARSALAFPRLPAVALGERVLHDYAALAEGAVAAQDEAPALLRVVDVAGKVLKTELRRRL